MTAAANRFYRIENTTSGYSLGIWPARNEDEAIEAMLAQAGAEEKASEIQAEEVGCQLDERLAGYARQWLALCADDADALEEVAELLDGIDPDDDALLLALQAAAPDFEQWAEIIENV